MYWGCSGDLGHHPCNVSDPHPLSFISIVGQIYAKSAEKANFAILRCGKWALWKNWSIDIGLMYWGCSGDLGHHPCKVSDPHHLSFISIVGKNYAKSAEKANFAILRCGKWALWKKLVHRYWVDVLGVLRGPRASSLQSFRCSSSFLHNDSWQKVLKKQILPYYGAANGRCGKNGP